MRNLMQAAHPSTARSSSARCSSRKYKEPNAATGLSPILWHAAPCRPLIAFERLATFKLCTQERMQPERALLQFGAVRGSGGYAHHVPAGQPHGQLEMLLQPLATTSGMGV